MRDRLQIAWGISGVALVALANCAALEPVGQAYAAPDPVEASEAPRSTATVDDAAMVEPEVDYTARGLTALSLPEVASAMAEGAVTSEALVGEYLARIALVDDPREGAPSLQSVLALNPDALEVARARDAERTAGQVRGALHGVPVLLKDNIESADRVPTTAGALALADNLTGRDSPLVAGLRAEGAVILGKTNLSQWANFRSEHSLSGWSALGGQVRNPHALDRNPCGSSSGSGAAVAAGLAAAAIGTETNGSIICPSNVNGIVGFKPTVGLVPQDFIVPISSSQDTAGPMTRTVRGAAMVLDAIAVGAAVSETEAEGDERASFAAGLDANSLAGTRVGVLRFAAGEQPDILARFDAALLALEAAGADLVEIETFEVEDGFWGQSRTVLDHEFKATLNAYLASSPAELPVRSLADVIAFNDAHAEVELALFGQDIFEGAEATEGVEAASYLAALEAVQRQTRAEGIDHLMAEHDVAVLVAPSGPLSPRIDAVNGDVWPAWAGAGYLAAIAGYPHLTVPMGAVHGIPIGLSFMAGAGDDGAVLSYGYAYEQVSGARPEPQYRKSADEDPMIATALRRME